MKNVTEQKNPKVDILSIVLSTLGFGGILYGFSIAGNVGWQSPHVILSLLLGIISLILFIRRQMKLEQPMLEFNVFKYKIFTLSTGLSMIVFVSMIGTAVILPLYMQNMLHFTAFHSGLVLLPGALIMGFMNPITGRLFDRFGARWLTIIGFFLLTVTTFMFTGLTEETTFLYLSVANAIRMLSIAMVMMPVTTAGLNELPKKLIPHGTAMSNTFRQVSGAIGTAMLITVMAMSSIPNIGVEGSIHGVNVSFIFASVISVIGLILSFQVKSVKVNG